MTTSSHDDQLGSERFSLRAELQAELQDAYPAVQGYILRRVRDVQTAENLTAETMLAYLAYRHKNPHPEHKPANLIGWLTNKAKYTLASYYGARGNRPPDDLFAELEDREHRLLVQRAESMALTVERAIDLERAFKKELTPDERSALVLSVVDGYSNSEIGFLLHKSKARAQQLIAQAMGKLKKSQLMASYGTAHDGGEER